MQIPGSIPFYCHLAIFNQRRKWHSSLIPSSNSKQNHQHQSYVYIMDFTEGLSLIRSLEHRKGNRIISEPYFVLHFWHSFEPFKEFCDLSFQCRDRFQFQITPSPKLSNWSWLWMQFPPFWQLKSSMTYISSFPKAWGVYLTECHRGLLNMIKDHWTCSQRERDLDLNPSSAIYYSWPWANHLASMSYHRCI